MLHTGTRVKIVKGDYAGKRGEVIGCGIVTVENGAYATATIRLDGGEEVTVKGGEAVAIVR